MHSLSSVSPLPGPSSGFLIFTISIMATASQMTPFPESPFPSSIFLYRPLRLNLLNSKHGFCSFSLVHPVQKFSMILQTHPRHIRLISKVLFPPHFQLGSFLPTFKSPGTSCISPPCCAPWRLCTFCPPRLEHPLIPNDCLAPSPPFVLCPDHVSAGKPPSSGYRRCPLCSQSSSCFPPLEHPTGSLEMIISPATLWMP